MAESMIGKTIGKYQIVELLGRGGMAEVYKAFQPALDRFVAIKLMHSFLADDKGFLGRFQREAKAVASLRHPNIVQVFDFDVTDGVYYMVMEFIDGYTLKAELQEVAARNEPLNLDESLRIARDIASALAFAHKRGMVHRDVKPANVMINRDRQVILTDFGIAKILSGPQYTASGAMIGTPAYMSPEQGLGEPGDARSDIYALGVMLFQMATGQLPYDADTPLAVVLKHVNDPLPIPSRLNPALDAGVERVIFRTMAKNPDDRYQTAAELVEHLDRLRAGRSIPELPAPTPYKGPTATPPESTLVARSPEVRTTPPPIPVFPARPKTGRPRWLLPLVGIGAAILLLIAAVIVVGLTGLLRSNGSTPTPERAAAFTMTPAPTFTPLPSPTITATPEPVETAIDPVDAARTVAAEEHATGTALAATATAGVPTATPTPSPSPSPSLTPTPACEYAYELIDYFTYGNPNYYDNDRNRTSAPTGSSQVAFTIRLLNTSTCSWPDGSYLDLIEGEPLGAGETITIESEVKPDETVELNAKMTTGDEAGLVVSTWRLFHPDGYEIGEPLEIRVFIYLPFTPTPTLPSAPAATPTSGDLGELEFHHYVHNCEYVGDDWRCLMDLTPFGGIGPPYTFWVFTTVEGVRYYGENQQFWITKRRCYAWVHNIKLQDDGGNTFQLDIYIDPNAYFPGGCVEP